MKRSALFAIALCVAAPFVAAPALADPTAPAPGHVHLMPTIVVTGRVIKPAVVVVTRPTAAHEAGAAHQALRDALLARTEPVTPRSPN